MTTGTLDEKLYELVSPWRLTSGIHIAVRATSATRCGRASEMWAPAHVPKDSAHDLRHVTCKRCLAGGVVVEAHQDASTRIVYLTEERTRK